ncbi:MAG: XTP/dITP diphosphatase [Selenomonadaceae bacterium]|nr:XTP/dITP diphosphatase [Selenomonadaceae bacterium]
MKKIVIATKNKGKIREMKDAFNGFNVEVAALDEFGELKEAVEDGETFEENAKIKAAHYQKLTDTAVIADDSGLEVEILDNAPGVYSARFAGGHESDAANNEKLIEEIKKRNATESPARYRCVLAFADVSGDMLLTDGACEGEIRLTPKGSGGFGYDPYFYIGEKSMAELTLEEKDKISHRGVALRKMVKLLEARGIIEAL